jgi:hypothetical protein
MMEWISLALWAFAFFMTGYGFGLRSARKSFEKLLRPDRY